MSAELTRSTSLLDRWFDRWREYGPQLDLQQRLNQPTSEPVTITGLSGSAETLVLKSLAESSERPLLVVCDRPDEAHNIYDDLLFCLGAGAVGHFPSRQILPYDFRAPVGEIMGRRISTLSAMQAGTLKVAVTTIRAVMEPTIPKAELQHGSVDLSIGTEIDLDDLVDRLVRLGFHRVPLVEEVGDFALRGGLIDFFSPGAEAPVRIELFGNEVETIRSFDVGSQRTTGKLDRVTVLPKREIPITTGTLEQYLQVLPEDDADYIRTRYLNDPELPGLEWLAIMFGMEQGSLQDYLTDNQIIYFRGLGSLREEAVKIITEAAQLRERVSGRISNLPTPEQYYQNPETMFEKLTEFSTVDRVPFKGGRGSIIAFDCQPHPSFGSRLDLLGKELAGYNSTGIDYFIATDTTGQAERLAELIQEKSEFKEEARVEVAALAGGFVCPPAGLALLTDHEIFGRYHRRVRKKKYREGVAITDYTSLLKGDFVVHTEFGIARYLGLETITVDERSRDCLVLSYAGKDKLFVPIEEFNRVSKYAGKDQSPELTQLGGRTWEKLKKRSKKAIAEMAEELIKLYATRKASRGYSCGDDTTWLKQLEASFPFEETPDQAKAINDVKRDLALDTSMDRLVCGDVGFGKTEVAVRAAFKAIDAGKQVAVLVPTTILAQQHFSTFSERMSDFPIKIGLLSRFRTRKELLKTVEEIAAGTLDLVIGTHRLLSKDVAFKDLGLLVIDEEHRFGVKHKESLRKLKATVHTLAMTATPIPRTLQMSLMGVRDMSLIATSPKDRLPIATEIAEFDPAVIATAILREIDRGGQVFFVHNRVQTIEAMQHYLKKTIPQAEIAIAHGQMHERSLEGIMLAFLNGRFDVLLCTSIIESGLDIPNANTIIVNRADRFGLAQLYQIRGRVGRSSRRAYAYLLTPQVRLLKRDAVKRLRALEAHSDLGSGFALAMRDLEIRGAGTILGARQSGFIEELGFDLYQKMLEEEISRLRGEEIIRLPETRVETDYELLLPDRYVNNSQQKVDIYKRLAGCVNIDQVEHIREEVTDRFGRMPQSASDLFDAASVKILAAMLEAEKLTFRNGQARIFFGENKQLQRSEVENLRKATDCPMEFSLIGIPRIDLDLSSVATDTRMSYLRSVLAKI